MTHTLELLHTRRSVKAADIQEPGPDAQTIESILQAAHRVPDHGKIGPWRFVVFTGDNRARFGEHLAKIYQQNNPDASAKLLQHQRTLLCRAPCVIAVIASPNIDHPKVPVWEQHLAVGAVCQNLLVATHSLGFAGQWLTEWYSYDSDVANLLAMKATEQVAGFLYLGTARAKPDERVRPDLQERVHFWA